MLVPFTLPYFLLLFTFLLFYLFNYFYPMLFFVHLDGFLQATFSFMSHRLLNKNISFYLLFSGHHILPNSSLLHYSFIYQLSYTALCLSTHIIAHVPSCCVYNDHLQGESIHLLCSKFSL